MPSRRPPKKGSFGGHFDELMKHFQHSRAHDEAADEDKPKPKRMTPAKVNRILLDEARH